MRAVCDSHIFFNERGAMCVIASVRHFHMLLDLISLPHCLLEGTFHQAYEITGLQDHETDGFTKMLLRVPHKRVQCHKFTLTK